MVYMYGWEKLNEAIGTLTGPDSQKQRLAQAIASLSLIRPEQNLPPEMRAEFEQFMKELNSRLAQADEGTIQATVQGLDELQVRDAIDEMISFYDRICRYMPRQ